MRSKGLTDFVDLDDPDANLFCVVQKDDSGQRICGLTKPQANRRRKPASIAPEKQ